MKTTNIYLMFIAIGVMLQTCNNSIPSAQHVYIDNASSISPEGQTVRVINAWEAKGNCSCH